MNRIALQILTGDKSKYLGMIFGVSFATLLMAQQVSVFLGVMRRTGNQILDVRDAPIWVMDDKIRYVDEVPGLTAGDVLRVRGVPGIDWAVPLYKGQLRARLDNGQTRTVILFGLDDATLVGAPQKMLLGTVDALRQADAVVIDKAGYEYMWPGEPVRLGRELEIGERRAVVVGICQASSPFFSIPVVYTRYSLARRYAPGERNLTSFVLARPADGVSLDEACRRIQEQTGLLALTQSQLFWKTIGYFLSSTGIPINFGITIALGFIVGLAVAGQTFYLFTIENLRQFAALKAMGLTNRRIVGMIGLQAATVGAIGFGVGMGLTAAFFQSTSRLTHMAGLHMFWQVMLGVAAAVMLIVLGASLMSVRRVLVLEPAVVFRG
jgi:putative ABC transport system permease protein